MKKLGTFTAITALCLQTSMAQAGGLAPTVDEPITILPEPQGTAAGIIVPLLVLALLGAASSAGGTNDDGDGGGDVFEESDIHLKENIVSVGTTAHGLTLYHFNYIGDDVRYEGVMAQDVATIMPEAVKTMDNGFLGVNYGMLGIEMSIVD